MRRSMLIFTALLVFSFSLSIPSFAYDDDAVDLSDAGDNPTVYSPSMSNTTPAGMASGEPIYKACPTCLGEGEVRCRTCNGMGIQDCVICHGSGSVQYKDDNGEWITETCNSCQGSGTHVCLDCNGNPYDLCPTCRGEGSIAN